MSEDDVAAKALAARRQLDEATAENLNEILQVLEDARLRLLARALHGTDADSAYARAMLVLVNEEIARIERELQPVVSQHFRDSMAAADERVLEEARGVLSPGTFVGIAGLDRTLIDYARTDAADLVRAISTDLRSKLNRIFRTAVTGALTSDQVATAIGGTLLEANRPTGVFGSIATQTEHVHRTETGRLYEETTRARREKLGTDTGLKIRKGWIAEIGAPPWHRHTELNGVVIDLDQKFKVPRWTTSKGVAVKVGYAEADGPLDPALPADCVVNCQCASFSDIPKAEAA
jgi:hypothetical protein